MRVLRYIILLLVSHGFCLFAIGQSRTVMDSLEHQLNFMPGDTQKVKMYIKLAHEYGRAGDRKHAQVYLQKALSLSEKLDYRKGIGTSRRFMGKYVYDDYQYAEALKAYLLALAVFEDIDDKPEQARMHTYIAGVYSAMGKDSISLHHYQQSLPFYEALRDEKNMAAAYSYIGDAYFYSGYFVKRQVGVRDTGFHWEMGAYYNGKWA